MPMSFSSILGGASTLIGTSTNLIISGLIIAAGLPTLNIFAPSLVGIPAAFLGIAFLMTIGTRLLPEGQQEKDSSEKQNLVSVKQKDPSWSTSSVLMKIQKYLIINQEFLESEDYFTA
jgi:hypothetical protein